jgi:hypothetical protein
MPSYDVAEATSARPWKLAEAAVAKYERALPKLRAEVGAATERAADLKGRLAGPHTPPLLSST